jgi:hypothetical protein
VTTSEIIDFHSLSVGFIAKTSPSSLPQLPEPDHSPSGVLLPQQHTLRLHHNTTSRTTYPRFPRSSIRATVAKELSQARSIYTSP